MIFFLLPKMQNFAFCILPSPRNWGVGLDITILTCGLAFRPLRRGCMIFIIFYLNTDYRDDTDDTDDTDNTDDTDDA